MNAPEVAQEKPEILETIKIAIIDDAFDEYSDVTNDDVIDFWNDVNNERVQNHEQIISEFTAFTKEIDKQINKSSEIDEKTLQRLWSNKENYSSLKPLINRLFHNKIEKLEPLEKIKDAINVFNSSTSNLNFEVNSYGSNVDVTEELIDVDIILLDYRLGSEADNSPIDNSREIAESIYKLADAANKLPLLILMSSDENVLDAQETFRISTKWLKGLFYCTLKSELTDTENIELNLLIWKRQAKNGLKIYEFINSVIESIEDNKGKFIDAISDLSLEDYSYVGNFSLKTEGQPLGEYMLWLFNCYLGDLFFDKNSKLLEKQTKIDSIAEFDPLPVVAQLSPSMYLVEMYESSLFKIFVEDNTEISIRQGTTFINKDLRKAYMVLNAECDLLRNPIPNVTLIEGELNEISKSDELREQDIKLLRLKDKKNYRIKWNWKNTKTVEYDKVLESMVNYDYTPFGVLRTPFFYKVQQYYVNQFSRVGLPVTPPIYQQTKVELFSKLSSKAISLPTEDIVFLISKKNNNGKFERECRFTKEFVIALREHLYKVINNIDEEGKKVFKQKRIDTLSEKLKTFNLYFIQNSSTIIKDSGVTSLFDNTIGITLNNTFDGFDDWNDYLLIINIITTSNYEAVSE